MRKGFGRGTLTMLVATAALCSAPRCQSADIDVESVLTDSSLQLRPVWQYVEGAVSTNEWLSVRAAADPFPFEAVAVQHDDDQAEVAVLDVSGELVRTLVLASRTSREAVALCDSTRRALVPSFNSAELKLFSYEGTVIPSAVSGVPDNLSQLAPDRLLAVWRATIDPPRSDRACLLNGQGGRIAAVGPPDVSEPAVDACEQRLYILEAEEEFPPVYKRPGPIRLVCYDFDGEELWSADAGFRSRNSSEQLAAGCGAVALLTFAEGSGPVESLRIFDSAGRERYAVALSCAYGRVNVAAAEGRDVYAALLPERPRGSGDAKTRPWLVRVHDLSDGQPQVWEHVLAASQSRLGGLRWKFSLSPDGESIALGVIRRVGDYSQDWESYVVVLREGGVVGWMRSGEVSREAVAWLADDVLLVQENRGASVYVLR